MTFSHYSVLQSLQVGAENVDVALSLIGYPSEVASAMEYVFGRTLVCRTLDMAKKVRVTENNTVPLLAVLPDQC